MIQQAAGSKDPDILASVKALRRAARRALEIGLATGTPVYVMKAGKIVDLTREMAGAPLPAPTAGKDYSGKFVVRVGKDLHRELTIGALRDGVSLNSYCAKVLREGRAPYGRVMCAERSRPSQAKATGSSRRGR